MSGRIDWFVHLLRLRAIGMPRALRCSFCGRPAAEPDRLVAGAAAHICDVCIAKCVAVLEDHGGMPAEPKLQ